MEVVIQLVEDRFDRFGEVFRVIHLVFQEDENGVTVDMDLLDVGMLILGRVFDEDIAFFEQLVVGDLLGDDVFPVAHTLADNGIFHPIAFLVVKYILYGIT